MFNTFPKKVKSHDIKGEVVSQMLYWNNLYNYHLEICFAIIHEICLNKALIITATVFKES